jgi:predicted porin
MNKNILAIAIAAASVVAAPSVFAKSTVYGQAHMGLGQQSGIANGTDTESAFQVMSHSSRLGIKGSEDLGAGLKAVYQFETGVAFDGENSNSSGLGGQRNTFAGIGGGFGTVLFGKHDSPIKLVGRKYDLFGDQIGNNRALTGSGTIGTNNSNAVGGLVDGRHNNVIAYQSPKMGGFDALLAYVPGAAGDNERDSRESQKGDAYSAQLNFKAGAFDAALGYIAINTKGTAVTGIGTANNDFNAVRLAAGYSFGAAKIVANYQNDNAIKAFGGSGTRDVFGLGASYKVTAAGTVKAQYSMAGNWGNNASTGANLLAVGYDHAMSKNTTVYANYALMDNQKNGTYSVNPSSSGSGENFNAVMGKDSSAIAVGLIHKF